MSTSRRTLLVALVVVCASQVRADGPTRERIYLSAPLAPDFAAWDGVYPETQEAREGLARNSVASFADLLEPCSRTHPEIVLGDNLTNEQLERNYFAVAECAFERPGAQPYWLPRLLDDVDVCALTLGDGWHMFTQAEFLALPDEAVRSFQDALMNVIATHEDPGWEWLTLISYIRGDDGSLQMGRLAVGDARRMAPVDARSTSLDRTGGIGLRCFRRVDVVPQ